VLDSVRAQDERRPIFYCSAFPQDFQRRSGGKTTFVERMDALIRSPHTFYYPKSELNVNRRLKEFTQAVYWQAFGYAVNTLLNDADKSLLTMAQVRTEKRLYRVLGPAARGWTRVRELTQKRATAEEVVPTKLLTRAGIKGVHIDHIIIEYDGGQVLSFFRPADLKVSKLSPRVIAALTSGEGSD